MGIIKVSVYQKSLEEGLTRAAFTKLTSLKSEFLIFPEYFFADKTAKDLKGVLAKSEHALDWLLKLNDKYRGIIVGGSLLREEGGKIYNATPIVFNGMVVDWYRKRDLKDEESKLLAPGEEPGIFILNGHRFAVLNTTDVLNPERFKELADMGIQIVFVVMNSLYEEDGPADQQERDEELFCKPARDYGMFITKCASAGMIYGTPVRGRSMVATPSGVSWRIAPQEENKEILKTVMLNVSL